jgi:hypothetical protein
LKLKINLDLKNIILIFFIIINIVLYSIKLNFFLKIQNNYLLIFYYYLQINKKMMINPNNFFQDTTGKTNILNFQNSLSHN